MSFIDKVIWSEGLFLQPQHFQQQDRYFESLILQQPGVIRLHHWGITELKIDENLLAIGKFAITICRGILPDGTPFDIPTRDKAPPPIELPEGLVNQVLYLALPVRRAGTAETGISENEKTNASWRYITETTQVSDNNASADATTSLSIGKLNLRLVLEKEDRQGLSCLGLARILELHPDRKIIFDNQYLPTCLTIQALSALSSVAQEIHGLLHYRGNMLLQRLTEAGTGGVTEIADFMLLQLINRYEPLFIHLNQLSNLHPEEFYRLLLPLVGELATFTSSQRRPINFPPYQHNNLAETFQPLILELRRALSMLLEENAIALKIELQQAGLWISPLLDKTLLTKAYFVLAIHADMPLENLRNLFPGQTKIAPVEEIRNLVSRSLPGIELNPLPVAPRQIPYHANFIYFTLQRNPAVWQKLEKSAALAFHIGGQFPGLRLELWAIKEK